jgi:fructose-bisphosphate aldolase class II
MASITLRQLLNHAAGHGYGVPALNINKMAQGIAIMDAARKCGAPVIVQASHGARAHADETMLRWIVEALAEPYSEIPICMHHDHGNDVSTCLSAIRNGFTSVMMDGSLNADAKTPADYDYNAGVTRTVADLAHMVGASVEGDLGCLGSLESGKGALSRGQLLTDPDEAARFVAETGVNALAVAIGSSHEAYEFSGKPDGAVLAMDVIEKIHARLPNTHIMMRGSYSVPQESQNAFNDYGGEMRPTSGVPVEKSSAASAMACARSTSTPIRALPPPLPFAAPTPWTAANLTPARS